MADGERYDDDITAIGSASRPAGQPSNGDLSREAHRLRQREEDDELADTQPDDKQIERDETSSSLHYGSGREVELLGTPEGEDGEFAPSDEELIVESGGVELGPALLDTTPTANGAPTNPAGGDADLGPFETTRHGRIDSDAAEPSSERGAEAPASTAPIDPSDGPRPLADDPAAATIAASPATSGPAPVAPSGSPSDLTLSAALVDENSAAGTIVATAAASPAGAAGLYTFRLADDAGGRFAIDPATGVLTVAPGAALDFEAVGSFDITIEVTDTSGFDYSETFSIALNDVNEFSVTPVLDTDATADQVAENTAAGTVVGVTAFASDGDGSDSVAYSLTSNPSNLFAVDPTTGVVTVAAGAVLDYEAATSHTIEVTATSTDGSTSAQSFTIAVADDNSEFSVTPVTDTDATADHVAEDATVGTTVGVTAFASDGDGSDSVAYSLTDDAGGRFAIDAATGVVTLADPSLLDYTTATSHAIEVTATSTDGSASSQTLTIDVVQADEDYDHLGVPTDDTISSGIGHDTLYGGAGSDTITSGKGNDLVYGGSGVDAIDGGAGNDQLYGGSGNDAVSGGAGNDSLYGGSGDDQVFGNDGNDTLYGGVGDDTMDGGDGHDVIYGNLGNDTLYGGDKVDTLYGGRGDDTLNGGTGDDISYGEDGSDLFIFQEGGGTDQIDGGAGGGWTDVLRLQDASGGAPTGGWTYTITQGSVVSSGGDFVDLSDDADGSVTLADGSTVNFNDIERVEW